MSVSVGDRPYHRLGWATDFTVRSALLAGDNSREITKRIRDLVNNGKTRRSLKFRVAILIGVSQGSIKSQRLNDD
ncbi:MAG: hypothetical protein VKK04_21665 [Synechococcales bacterium]|nr:hypothetical protein [Synechococcales bacterium]